MLLLFQVSVGSFSKPHGELLASWRLKQRRLAGAGPSFSLLHLPQMDLRVANSFTDMKQYPGSFYPE